MQPASLNRQGPARAEDGAALLQAYRRCFEAVPADTRELIEAAHRIRYQVYCVENNFLPIEENPGGLERDAYDEHSVQAILIHRASGTIAGCVRLVLPRPDSTEGCLPFHEVCKHPMTRDPRVLPVAATAEFSRLAISKQFRRRAGDGLFGRIYDNDELRGDFRRIIPHMSLGLMTVALEMGLKRNVNVVCALMDPALLRHIGRLGIHFIPLGPPIDYHGVRQPCYSPLSLLYARLESERPDIWAVLTDAGRLWSSSANWERTCGGSATAVA